MQDSWLVPIEADNSPSHNPGTLLRHQHCWPCLYQGTLHVAGARHRERALGTCLAPFARGSASLIYIFANRTRQADVVRFILALGAILAANEQAC